MTWINFYGLAIIIIMMIPNTIFAMKHKEGFVNLWKNKYVEFFEQIGRIFTFCLMIFNIPGTWFGFFFLNGLLIYVIVDGILLLIYCIVWIICFNKNSIFKALALSIIPSIIFIFSGVMIVSIPLIVFAVIFAPCHICISYMNAKLEINRK